MEGFGSGSKKCYGRARDEPDSWPDTNSWKNFEGPSFAKLETCNEIIECQIDVNSYHLENEEVDEADQRDEDNQYDPPDNENKNIAPGPDMLDPFGY